MDEKQAPGPRSDYKAMTEKAVRDDMELLKAMEPPPPPPVPELSPRQQADLLHQRAQASYLYGTTNQIFGKAIDVRGHQVYIEDLLKEYGNPKDPIERLAVLKLITLFHSYHLSDFKAHNSPYDDIVRLFSHYAIKTSNSFDKGMGLLKEYRRRKKRKKTENRTKDVVHRLQGYLNGEAKPVEN